MNRYTLGAASLFAVCTSFSALALVQTTTKTSRDTMPRVTARPAPVPTTEASAHETRVVPIR